MVVPRQHSLPVGGSFGRDEGVPHKQRFGMQFGVLDGELPQGATSKLFAMKVTGQAEVFRDHLALVAVKSYAWFRTDKDGDTTWDHRTVPLREGIVDWRQVLELLGSLHYDGPVSLHSEYEDMSREELLRGTREDLAYLRSLLPEA